MAYGEEAVAEDFTVKLEQYKKQRRFFKYRRVLHFFTLV